MNIIDKVSAPAQKNNEEYRFYNFETAYGKERFATPGEKWDCIEWVENGEEYGDCIMTPDPSTAPGAEK